jgi:hypothetical protein
MYSVVLGMYASIASILAPSERSFNTFQVAHRDNDPSPRIGGMLATAEVEDPAKLSVCALRLPRFELHPQRKPQDPSNWMPTTTNMEEGLEADFPKRRRLLRQSNAT